MKKSVFIGLLWLPLFLFGQDKVVESSAKKIPGWIGLANRDFITASATDATLEGAQKKCLQEIRQQIITSIAANIVSVESSFASQVSENEVISLLEKYTSLINTQGVQLPFISNITLANADGIYWAKHYIKKEKRYYYQYYVKYPFSELQRVSLVDAFETMDRAKYKLLLHLKDHLDTFDNIEYIDYAIEELNPLIDYFFDVTRKREAQSLQTLYRKQYENITIISRSSTLGEYDFYLTLGGRIVTTSKKANLRSNCANNIEITPKNNGYVITYDCIDCLRTEDNWIEVGYVFGGRSLRHRFLFDIR